MTNAEIIRMYKRKDKLKVELREKKKVLRQVSARVEKLTDILSDLHRIDEIFEGMAITICGSGKAPGPRSIHAVADNVKHSRAHIYQNATDKRYYGLQLCERNQYIHCGYFWDDFNAALLAAKQWVSRGIVPPTNGKSE